MERSPSVSFLVRARAEEVESGAASVQIFLRNLQTGCEEYVRDPSRLGELVLRHLQTAQDESGAETGTGEASRAGD